MEAHPIYWPGSIPTPPQVKNGMSLLANRPRCNSHFSSSALNSVSAVRKPGLETFFYAPL